MYGELSQTALKCNFIEYDNSLTAIYVRSISAAFFYAGKFADNKLFRLKGEHSIIIMSSGNSIYCLDYKGDIDRCIRYGRKHFIFCIRMDHQRPHINKARCDMLARMQTKNARSVIPSQYRQSLKSSQVDID